MSSLLYRIARACYRARWRVVAAWLGFVVLLGAVTLAAGGKFNDEFRIPGASSQVALDQLRMTFPAAAYSSATVVVLAPEGTTLDDPAIKDALDASAKDFESIPWVKTVQLPHNKYVKGLLSDDKTAGYLSVRVQEGLTASTMTEAQRELIREKAQRLQEAIPGSEVHVGGELFAMNLPKVTVVELIGVGVAVAVLIAVLGSLWAAFMPIASALIGAAISMMLIVIGAGVTKINSTTMILALMLALAVGIDYSLFIVSRHRDQLAAGLDAEESAARATATAGSAVVFAGLTVIVALAGLAVAGLPFLTTMGLFASLAVAVEVAIALTLLPAMLGLAGERLRPKAAKQARKLQPGSLSRWWVGVVTRFPVITIVAVVVGLGALSVPAANLEMALPNSGRNPPGAADRITFDLISERFGVGYNGPLVITGTIVESDDPLGIVEGIAADVEKMPGVKLVAAAVPNENADTAMIQVIPTTGPDDPATVKLVADLRAMAPQWQRDYGIGTSVTGFTATAIDVSSRLGAALVPFGILVVGLSLVLLTMVFRSIWVPIKAALGYLLSTGAAFGSVALVFNQGFLKQVINLPETLPVISFLPIMLMGILFGLAMDYEVFLTSRMREEYVHGNTRSFVQEGFIHSGKVVVAAAVIMFAVFAFFVPSGEGVIKPIAFGLAIGVAIDAFLIRMTLGPAVMQLLGTRAWWLPRWLDRSMPVMDVEGEALAHQLSLADWPTPEATHIVYGEGLTARTDEVELFADVKVAAQPGEVVVVTGPHRSREALLLALTGRLQLTAGQLKVLGLALPEEASVLRRRATFVEGASADADYLLAHPRELVVVDDADRLSPEARQSLAALLRPATPAAVASGHADNASGAEAEQTAAPAVRTFVLGVTHAESVRDLLPATSSVLALAGAEALTGGVR